MHLPGMEMRSSCMVLSFWEGGFEVKARKKKWEQISSEHFDQLKSSVQEAVHLSNAKTTFVLISRIL